MLLAQVGRDGNIGHTVGRDTTQAAFPLDGGISSMGQIQGAASSLLVKDVAAELLLAQMDVHRWLGAHWVLTSQLRLLVLVLFKQLPLIQATPHFHRLPASVAQHSSSPSQPQNERSRFNLFGQFRKKRRDEEQQHSAAEAPPATQMAQVPLASTVTRHTVTSVTPPSLATPSGSFCPLASPTSSRGPLVSVDPPPGGV